MLSAAYDILALHRLLHAGGRRQECRSQRRLILVGIDGTETLRFQTALVSPTGGIAPYQPCLSPMLSSTCIEALQHSCENQAQPEFFAETRRCELNAVINKVTKHNVTSICGEDLTQAPDFTQALQQLGKLISNSLGVACLSSPIFNSDAPDCVVEDRADGDNHVVDTIDSCAQSKNMQPCWAYVQNGKCPKVVNPIDNSVTQGSIGIMRDQSAIPMGTHLSVACATVAHTSSPSPSPSH